MPSSTKPDDVSERAWECGVLCYWCDSATCEPALVKMTTDEILEMIGTFPEWDRVIAMQKIARFARAADKFAGYLRELASSVFDPLLPPRTKAEAEVAFQVVKSYTPETKQ